MNEAFAGQANTQAMPMREKYWEECDADQKLDRLRDSIARLCREVTVLSQAVRRLASHTHGEQGLLVPIHMTDENANYAGNALGGVGSNGLFAHDNGIPHNLRTKRERRE